MTNEEASFLQVGDEVFVRNWEDMANEYEVNDGVIIVPCRFVPSMRDFCGKTFVIKKIRDGVSDYLLRGAHSRVSAPCKIFSLEGAGIYDFTPQMLDIAPKMADFSGIKSLFNDIIGGS